MSRIGGFILVSLGVLLLLWGYNSAQSPGSDISEFFTGTPTDRTLWLVIGGALSSVMGLSLAFRRGRHA